VPRSGRRPADSRTREAIEKAARRQFATVGYDRTSLRSIAGEAGVDPALVSYFFRAKQRLFVEVVDLPFDPAHVVPMVFSAGPEAAGERLAHFLLTTLENPEMRERLIGLVRAAASEPEAADMFREVVARRLVGAIVEALDVEQAELRASLIGSQVVGLLMARYIVRVEPLASLPAATLIEAIAPNLQRYLTAPLSEGHGHR
jgi:AcrR family transcriptional regulator